MGRWYTEDDVHGLFAEYTYTADGIVYVDEYRKDFGYKRISQLGTYYLSDDVMAVSLESVTGLPIQYEYEIINQDALMFQTRNKDLGDTHFYRIVGIVCMRVGDMLNIDTLNCIEDYTSETFDIVSFDVNNGAIASVDGADVLTAKLIGVAYLKMRTTIGTAVLKISVTDEKNLWNDFSQGLGKSLDEVEELFGIHYAYRNDSVMQYFFDDYYVDSVEVFEHIGIADSIVVTFRQHVQTEDITGYLNDKLQFVKDTLSYHWYINSENYLFATYSARHYIDKRKLVLTANEVNWDERIFDYGLTYEELISKYGRARAGNKKTRTYDIKNDFISRISYHLTDNRVTSYSVYIDFAVKTSMIENYLTHNFLYLNSDFPYINNLQLNGQEMYVWVSIDSYNNHNLYYHFEKNK